MNDVDPITMEVIRCGLVTIANEMGDTMIRTATTPTFSESHDFSTSIFDSTGRIVALADALPIHMGACKFSVLAVLNTFGDDLHAGDIVLVNDPYHGGSHLPDWTMMTPMFFEGELIFFPVTRAHQGDTGGTVPGGYYPGATDIWQEGLRLPPIKIYDCGKPRDDIIRMLQINNREPTFLGDLHAMLGSVRVGERRLQEMLKRYGTDTIRKCLDAVISYTERRFRAEIRNWPAGQYTGEAYLEHDCQGVEDITVRVTVTVAEDSLRIDYTGSDPQVPGFINSSVPNSYSYIFLTLSSMIDDSIPRNEGLFLPVEIVLPAGTVVNPRPPAPCTACTLHAGGEVGEALAVALSQAVPEKAYVQNIKLGMPLVTYGTNPYSGEFYVDQNVMMSAGWCNAAHGVDGWGAMPSFFGAMTMATGELHDMYYPVQTLGREYITDSGGAGKWRGGLGTSARLTALAPMFVHTYVIGTKYPMRGCSGGSNGSPNRFVLRAGTPTETVVEKTAFEEPLSAGHETVAELGGGGGWGDPLQRDPAAVLDDVKDEYVSLEAARREYGVVIDAHGKLEVEATQQLRGILAAQRQPQAHEQARQVDYLSPEWQVLCQEAVNSDAEFARLAGDLTVDVDNIIEDCPDGKTRCLRWSFRNGKLIRTEVGILREGIENKASFGTVASYETFMKINSAKMKIDTAVMEGALRLQGDLVQMMQMADALNRFTEVRRTVPTRY